MKYRQLRTMSMSNNDVDVINLTMMRIRIKDVRVYTTYVTQRNGTITISSIVITFNLVGSHLRSIGRPSCPGHCGPEPLQQGSL